MSEWQPIETAPRDGSAVWLLIDGQAYLGFCQPADWLSDSDTWFAKASYVRRHRTANITTDDIVSCYGYDVKPTHWQSLPAPPSGERT